MDCFRYVIRQNEVLIDINMDYDIIDVQAYCGGLWIACCFAMANIAELIDPLSYDNFNQIGCNARQVYISKLWNGRYLHYDSSASLHHDSIMSDMLAGQWYIYSCNMSHSMNLLDIDQIYSCLKIIYEYNVLKFGNGKLIGAVNGSINPKSLHLSQHDDEVSNHQLIDNSCLQSREVWTGTTYGLASLMLCYTNHLKCLLLDDTTKQDTIKKIQLEMRIQEVTKMAYQTCQGIHDGGWQDFGYWFATPEAWDVNGNYRSLGYMRPLSIWAMEYSKL